MTIPDETLMAFADGTLPPEETARVAAALEADPDLAERVAALADGRRIAAGAFAEVLQEPVPARLLAAARAPAAVNDNRRPAWRIAGLAAAAGLLVGALLGAQFVPPGGAPARPGLLAGAIATALDGDAVTGVAVTGTHLAEGGLYCRRFVAEDGPGALLGLACREPEGWRLRAAVARGPRGGAFQPAGAEDPVLAEVLERLGAGAPLDAAAEAAARARGWRQP